MTDDENKAAQRTLTRGKGAKMGKAYVKGRNKGALRVAQLLGLPIEEMPKGAAPFSIVVTEQEKTKKGAPDGDSKNTRRKTRLGKDRND